MKIYLLFVLFFLCPNILSASQLNLTAQEKEYLKNHPIIVADNELSLPPFNFHENGEAKGFCPDYLRLVASKANITIRFISGYSWAEYMQMIKTDKLDILTDVVKTKERDKFIAFSPIYYETQMAIYTHTKTKNISTLEQLKGKTIAIPKDYFSQKYIAKDYPQIKQVLVTNQFEALKLLSLAKVDCVVGEKAAMDYLILNNSISEVKAVGFIEDKNMNSSIRMGVHNKDKILMDILIKAQKVLSASEVNQLKNKWFAYKEPAKLDNHAKLTPKERAYLQSKTEIKMCVDPDWMPIEEIDENGKHIGILSDYVALFSSRLHVRVSLQKTNTYLQSKAYLDSGKCDIIVGDVLTPSNKEQFLFTKPYFTMQRAFVVHTDTKGIQDFSQIAYEGEIGVLVNTPAVEILKELYPNIKLVAFDTMEKGLNAVANKQIIAYVGAMSTLAYSIRTNNILHVSIGGIINKDKVSILVNKNLAPLVPILNKAINTLSENDKIEILNRWVKVSYQKGVDYTLVWQISIVFIIIALISLFFILLLKQSNKKLQKSQAKNFALNSELSQLNETLEIRVKEQVEELERRYLLMAQKSRLTQMGEMLSNIAHQWRQPLNRINSNVAALHSALRRNPINHDMLLSQTGMIEENTHYMSETIEDFSNFFHPDKVETDFIVNKSIDKALHFLNQRTQNVEITLKIDKEFHLLSFEKEFLHVLLILLNNAVDNFESKAILKPSIDINVYEKNSDLHLSIYDNGKGIEEDKIEKIFDPYFSTKFAHEGTGLGLYMAKMIIENSMHGTLHVKNKNLGACFEICIPSRKKICTT